MFQSRIMRTRWTSWIGYAVAIWSAVYGAFGVWWALGGGGFPFGTGDPELMAEPAMAFKVSLLGWTTPQVAGPIIAVIGLTGAVVGVLMALGITAGWGRYLLPAYAWGAAIVLAVGIQDYRVLVVVAYTPIMAVAKLFGMWSNGTDWGDLYLAPRLNLLLCLFAGIGWGLTAIAYRRRVTDSCLTCGRNGARTPSFVDRWGRRAAWVAVAAPLFYCATRWAWALGFSLGIDPIAYQAAREQGLWLAGAALASVGLVGAVLTLGLIQRWGEVFPRWMLGLAGCRVRPMLAVIPAMFVSVILVATSFMYIRVVTIDGITPATWPLSLPETLFLVWGVALFIAALAYHRRRQGVCSNCGHGDDVQPSKGPDGVPRGEQVLMFQPAQREHQRFVQYGAEDRVGDRFLG